MTSVAIQPPGEAWKKGIKESKEDVGRRNQDVTLIKEWLVKQPHLPDEWDEDCLRNFLHACDYSLEKCKRKLDMYFTVRNACPEYFTNRDITSPELANAMAKGQGPSLSGLTPDGMRICVARAFDKCMVVEQLQYAFKIMLMIGDVRLREEQKDIVGDIYIVDGGIVDTSHIAKLSPIMIKKFVICIQEAYPVKLKQVHIINTSVLIDMIYKILKPFLKDKLKKRVYFHKDYTGLHKHIPKENLPTEWGGTGQSINEAHEAWHEKLKQYGEWFKEQESIKANESLRPGKPTNCDELFGLEGSFRQLTID